MASKGIVFVSYAGEEHEFHALISREAVIKKLNLKPGDKLFMYIGNTGKMCDTSQFEDNKLSPGSYVVIKNGSQGPVPLSFSILRRC